METVLAELSSTQRTVLITLKRLGEATAEDLAGKLDISASAVRQHLSVLRSAGVVTARQERGQPGRPTDHYYATEQAERLFVGGDARLSIDILEQVHEEDPEMVRRIFDRRRKRLVEGSRKRVEGKSIDECIAIVTELLDEQGYLADFEKVEDGHYRINLHSCAIWTVASRYRQACTAELDFIRDLLPDTTIERVTHRTDGAHACAYDIRIAN